MSHKLVASFMSPCDHWQMQQCFKVFTEIYKVFFLDIIPLLYSVGYKTNYCIKHAHGFAVVCIIAVMCSVHNFPIIVLTTVFKFASSASDIIPEDMDDSWPIPIHSKYDKTRSVCMILGMCCKCHHITLTSQWSRWRLKSSRLFTQPFIQTQNKENIKAPCNWPLCREFTGTGEFPAQRASYPENVSIWWRHHHLDAMS